MVLNLLDYFLPLLPGFQPIRIYLTLRKSIQINGLVKNVLEFISAPVTSADFKKFKNGGKAANKIFWMSLLQV